MKTIPLREFMLHGSAMLKDLPLILTVRGEPVCAVVPTTATQTEHVSTLKPASVNTPEPSVNTHEEHATITPRNYNRCHFCATIGATLHPYQYEDGSGEGEAFFCDPCWKKYEDSRMTTVSIPNDIRARPDIVTGARENPFRGSFPKPVKKKK